VELESENDRPLIFFFRTHLGRGGGSGINSKDLFK
jgi:hypothetical protein